MIFRHNNCRGGGEVALLLAAIPAFIAVIVLANSDMKQQAQRSAEITHRDTSYIYHLKVEAEIISINNNILRGEYSQQGQLLGSANAYGYIRDDTNKLGVRFHVKDHLFLKDFTLSNAQTAHFVELGKIPLVLTFHHTPRNGWVWQKMDICLENNTLVYTAYVKRDKMGDMVKELKSVASRYVPRPYI